MDANQEVSDMIVEIKKRGMKQYEIAQALNVNPAYITLFKSKQMSATDEEIEQLKKILTSLSPVEEITNDENEPVENESTYSEWLTQQMLVSKIHAINLSEKSGLSLQTINLITSGKTQNPQQSTKTKIEQALKELSNNNDQSFDSEIITPPVQGDENLYLGIPFTKSDIDDSPNQMGVYVIHDHRGYPTYIGSGQIRSRLRNHYEKRAFSDERIATTFSYIRINEGDSEEQKKAARNEARKWENIIIKFAGESVLLNNKLRLISERINEDE